MSDITRKEVFETRDGKSFNTKLAAEIHLLVLTKQADIQSFMDAARKDNGTATYPHKLRNGRINPQRERANKTITGWLEYEAMQAGSRSTGAEG